MAAQKNKLQKLIGWFILSLFMLLIAAGLIIWVKMPQKVISSLVEFTEEKSEGMYSLSVGGMERRLFPFTVTFRKVAFKPAGSPLATVTHLSQKTIYTFESESIEFQGIDVISFVRNKNFFCQKIRILKPAIKLEGEGLLQPDTLQAANNLISGIRPLFEFVDEVRIPKIEFEEANFGFYGAVGDSGFISKAEKVSVDVLGFKTNDTMLMRETRYIETDDVLIRMSDFRNDMGDSLHVLTIDTLLYSLKTTDIRAVGFRLFPMHRPISKNLFEVTVPDVYMKSRSITRFALNDSLEISFLEFKNPDIKFFQKENPEKLNIEDIDNFNLYSLVQNHFTKFEVDRFFLHGAHLEIFRKHDTEHYQQQFENISIILNGFLLDSTSARDRKKLLHADNVEMQVAGYHLRLEDDEHHFRADSLYVSTVSDRLTLKNIYIHPENVHPVNARTEVNIECEALNIEEVDLRSLYHTRSLPTSKIEVIEPVVQLTYHLEKEKHKDTSDGGLLFEVVTDYLNGIYSNLVFIENGSLDIKNSYNGALQGYFETSFNFSLTDFSLDSASVQRTDKFFYATNFDLRFSDYHMRLVDDLHRLNVENITVSSINQQVQIEKLDLRPVIENYNLANMQRFNRSELFHISVPQINLSGVDLRNAFFNKKLRISSFRISNPEIYFENFGTLRADKEKLELAEFYQLVFNYLEDFDIKQFLVPDGKLTWINHTRRGRTTSFDNDFSASLENFRLNEAELTKQRLFFSDDFDVTIKDQEFQLSDSVHVLKGNEIRFSSVNSSVNVKNALLFPLVTAENYPKLATTFQVAIPELKIEGFDFQKAWYSKRTEIRKIELVSPRFQIYSQAGLAKRLDLNAYRFPLPSFLESFHLSEFKITNGQAITYQTKGLKHSAQASFFLDLVMPGVMVKNDTQNQMQLSSKNIQIGINGFKVPIDNAHNLAIEKIDFDRERKTIKLENLKVNPFHMTQSQNCFSISAPAIRFSDFDLNKALNTNNFEFGDIEVANPEIFIDIKQKMTGDTLEFLQTLDLYPYVEDLVNEIRVKNFMLGNATLHFNWLEKALFSNKVNLAFKNILISENQHPSNLLNSSEFELSTTNITTHSRDELYAFSADSLIYNSARHRVQLKNIAVKPLVERDVFPLQNGFQTDVASAKIAFAELRGIDERRWFQDNVLDAGALFIGPADVEIFRNKRFPFNPYQRPPWPQELIKNAKLPFVFDSVFLLPSNIRYSELLPISEEPGFIEFTDLAFAGGSLSNITSELEKNGNFELNASARLLNHAVLSVRFSFDLNSPDYYHTASGTLEPMSLLPLNSMISKAEPLAVEEGQLNRLDFDLAFDEYSANGVLYLGYDNLKIAVLDYSKGDIQKARFASYLANKMIINSENPKSGELLPVDISYRRDEQRSVLNYWWKSLYSGAKVILGLDE